MEREVLKHPLRMVCVKYLGIYLFCPVLSIEEARFTGKVNGLYVIELLDTLPSMNFLCPNLSWLIVSRAVIWSDVTPRS